MYFKQFNCLLFFSLLSLSLRHVLSCQITPLHSGQRSEPEAQGGLGAGAFGGWPGMIFGDGGSHLSFGIGAFPFAFFASAFNLNDGRPPPPELGTPQYAEERFLNRVFVCVSVLFAIWLLLL